MKLEMRYFDAADARFDIRTSYSNGLLTICKSELIQYLSDDTRIDIVDIEMAHPGEEARITNVLEITEPRIKPDHDGYFPGMLAPIWCSGESVTNVLRGCAVLEIGSIEGFYGGLIDMSGEGASLTPYSGTHNICLLTKPAPGTTTIEYGVALKNAGMKTCVYLARATRGAQPTSQEFFDLVRPHKRLEGLPRVGYLFQLHSHGRSREPFIYGGNSRRYYPTVLHPNEIIDGAIVCGHYNIPVCMKNTTYTILNHPVILGLYRRHGKDLNFKGVVLAPEPTSLVEIRRTSMMAANLLKYTLKVDGVIITKEGGGHTDVDLMENCDACESLGIKTVLIDDEWLGPEGVGIFPLLAHSKNANAMVSVGNVDAIVELPAMARIIGGKRMPDFDGDLGGGLHLPLRFIPNGISQAGLTYLRAEEY